MRKINSGEELLNKLYKNLYLEYKRDSKSTPSERITKLLNRLEDVTKEAIKKDKYELLKKMYYNKYIIKEIPDSYYKLQEKIAFEQGHGRIVYNDNMKKEAKNTIVSDQKASLDEWLDYFNSNDATYPMWAKYWAFQGMLKIGSYDKENQKFTKRTKSTTNVFIELNREVLALSIDYVQQFIDEDTKTDDNKLNELIESGSFQKIYEHVYNTTIFQKKNYDSTDGVWVKYNRGSDHMPLVKSLIGKGTGWCTAGESTARTQLNMGDFHVYYSKDENGEYTNPRIAIRMKDNAIAEIRGVAKNQNLEASLEDILDEKLNEFPDKDEYLKKSNDMKMLTKIYDKYQQKIDLTKDDILFLYEIEQSIEGFGYKKDPRIKEIKDTRDFKKDLTYALSCRETEISNNPVDLCSGKKLKYYANFINAENINQTGFKMPEILADGMYLGDYGTRLIGKFEFPSRLNGDLNLEGIIEVESLIFPENLNRRINLGNLQKVKELVFPTTINGDLNLDSLTSAEGLVLPTIINGDLSLDNFTSAEGLVLPTTMNGNLYLDSLTSAEGLVLPTIINGSLSLDSLTSAEGLVLPTIVDGRLSFRELTSAEGLVLPTTINGFLNLCNLMSAEGLVLPTTMNGDLYLNSLTSAEGLVLPTTMNGDLYLNSLTSAEGLVLPTTMNGSLNLDSLTSAEGLVLPTIEDGNLKINKLDNLNGIVINDNFKCSGRIIYQDTYYSSDEFKQKVRVENIINTKNEARHK